MMNTTSLLVTLSLLGGICPDYNPLKNAYFGDLGAHSSYSLEAYGVGTRRTPLEALAFARGTPARLGSGVVAQLSRPLDFAALSDQSEAFDVLKECVLPEAATGGVLYFSEYCLRARELLQYHGTHGEPSLLMRAMQADWPQRPQVQVDSGAVARLCQGATGLEDPACQLARHLLWVQHLAMTEAANQPCGFTTFPAYQWSGTPAWPGTPASATAAPLHRTVLFSSALVPFAPLDSVGYPTAYTLFSNLQQQCLPSLGCEALTVLRVPRQSQGLAFVPDLQGDGSAGSYAAMEADLRARYERLVEVYERSGSSECLPADPSASGADRECAYENATWSAPAAQRQRDMRGYVRTGLNQGLVWHALTRANPFQLGLVGSSGSLNGTPGLVEEHAFGGHAGALDDTPEERVTGHGSTNPGGLTVVWAEQNTRQSLFSALQRREVYTTSGPRMVVRFYQTWDQGTDFCQDPDFPRQLLQQGAVPMGATMPPPPSSSARPRFIVHATMDQTRLQALELVKVSVQGPWSPARETLRRVSSSNPQGESTWCHTWEDSGFDPQARAYYYARVLEQPTWRYSHHDCQALRTRYPDWRQRFPACDCAPGSAQCLDRSQQERAWTSPIWALP